MTEDRVREMLDQYVNTIYTQVSSSALMYIGGLALFWAAWWYLRRPKKTQRRYRASDTTDLSVSQADIAFGMVPITMPAAARPGDESYFQTVLDFAQSKITRGQPLMPQEHFALGELSFLNRVVAPDGAAYLDSFPNGLPHKAHELQQALQQIGADDLINPIEEAVAVDIHRRQLVNDIMATGTSRDKALQHPDMPQHDRLMKTLSDSGASTYFTQKADAYFADHYPWSNTQ